MNSAKRRSYIHPQTLAAILTARHVDNESIEIIQHDYNLEPAALAKLSWRLQLIPDDGVQTPQGDPHAIDIHQGTEAETIPPPPIERLSATPERLSSTPSSHSAHRPPQPGPVNGTSMYGAKIMSEQPVPYSRSQQLRSQIDENPLDPNSPMYDRPRDPPKVYQILWVKVGPRCRPDSQRFEQK